MPRKRKGCSLTPKTVQAKRQRQLRAQQNDQENENRSGAESIGNRHRRDNETELERKQRRYLNRVSSQSLRQRET